MISSGTHSFRSRLVIATVITVFLLQVFGALVDIYVGYSRLSTELDVKGRLLAEQTSVAISRPVLDFDEAIVQEILEGLFDISNVARVAFVPAMGEGGVELFVDGISEQSTLRLYSEPIDIYFDTAAETLGVLDVTLSTAGLKAELWKLLIFKSILVLAILSLATAVLHIVLGRLSKPLEDLHDAIHAMEREEFDQPVPGGDRHDEIGALANALDGLRERETELATLRRASSEKAIREGMRIQHALNSTRDVVVLVDETNKIIFRNASAKTFFPEFSIGDTLVEHSGEKRSGAEQVRLALFTRSEMVSEISIVRHGATRHFQARTGPIVDNDGNDLGGLFLASDFTEQFEHSKEATYLASHDPLTGLLNRRQMDVALAKWSENTGQLVGMMMVDLDNFKEINDTLGHQIGDSLLMELARLLGEISNSDDQVIRLGGDEFAIVTRGAGSERHLDMIASTAINKLQNSILIEGHLVKMSISAGIALSIIPKTGWSSETLMQHADLALYKAKNGGRGRYEIFEK
ncbi:MAG: diguanylate cyclase (GGDEF)-like protein [Yoonia sp.]|jgi:diguanylate cyclase (GGDEF)-like protein